MKGVVVCPQPRAAEVGAKILEKGDNAFDAAYTRCHQQMAAQYGGNAKKA